MKITFAHSADAHRYNTTVYFYTANCFRFTDLQQDLYKTGNVIKHPQRLC